MDKCAPAGKSRQFICNQPRSGGRRTKFFVSMHALFKNSSFYAKEAKAAWPGANVWQWCERTRSQVLRVGATRVPGARIVSIRSRQVAKPARESGASLVPDLLGANCPQIRRCYGSRPCCGLGTSLRQEATARQATRVPWLAAPPRHDYSRLSADKTRAKAATAFANWGWVMVSGGVKLMTLPNSPSGRKTNPAASKALMAAKVSTVAGVPS